MLPSALAALLLLAPAPTAQDDDERLSFFPPDPVTVPMAAQDGGQQGRFTVLVANSSDYTGPLDVKWLPTSAAPARAVGKIVDAFPSNGSALVRRGTRAPKIAARDSVRLTLFLRIPAGAKAPAVGTLAVSPEDGSLAPALLKVTSTPVTEPLAAGEFQPERVGIEVSTCLPAVLRALKSCSGEADLEVHGLPEGAEIAQGPVVQTVLGAETSGTADVAIQLDETTVGPEGTAGGRVEATEISRSRTYEGELVLDPDDDESPNLPVTITVRDFVLWPILAILAGVGVAYGIMRWRELGRPKRVLRGALSATAERYAKAKASRAPNYFPYGLSELFPDTWSRPSGQAAESAPVAEKLWFDIGGASKEQLVAVEQEVTDLRKQVALWEAAGAAANELRRARARLSQALGAGVVSGPGAPAIAVRTDQMVGVNPRPESVADATDRVTALGTQREAIGRWLVGWHIYKKAKQLFDELGSPSRGLTRDELSRRNACNPDAIRESALWEAGDLEELEDSRAVRSLRDCYRVLLTIDAAHPVAGAQAVEQEQEEPPTLPAPAPREPVPVSRQIADEVAQRDLWISGLAAIPVIGLFLFTFYDDGAFGAWWEYAAAFFGGAGGQVAINWQLLPGWGGRK